MDRDDVMVDVMVDVMGDVMDDVMETGDTTRLDTRGGYS